MRYACTLSVLVLFLVSLTACSTTPRTTTSGLARPSAEAAPTGSFVAPGTVKLRLHPDGTYVAEDIGPPEFWVMVEGMRPYPQRVKFPPQKGRWTWDRETGDVTLTAETSESYRWGIQHLRFDKDNPNRLAWGPFAFFERAETVQPDAALSPK